MAIKNTSFSIVVGTAPHTALASVAGTYARLSEAVVTSRYEAEMIPNPAKTADSVGEPDYLQVFVKKQTVTGKLDIYALDTDVANGIPALVMGREYSCNHISGSVAEAELYVHIMALPEFFGSVAA